MRAHWQMFAAYNRWANALIFEHAARLSDEDYRADCGVFFKSVHGTLNHLLVADRIWMQRITGANASPMRLDAILYDAFQDLREARVAEDRLIIAFVEGLDEAALSRWFRYRAISAAVEFEQELASALAHWFNHQTHHRGQLHGLLTRLSGEAPVLDFLAFQRSCGAGVIRSIA
jgi:uncharacterized damage-inducible protein DinB